MDGAQTRGTDAPLKLHLKNKTSLERYGHDQKKIKKQRQQFEGFIFFFPVQQ